MSEKGNQRTRMGIVLVGEKLNSPALKTLVLAMNNIQRHFEYEFLPFDESDALLTELAKSEELDRDKVRTLANKFPSRFGVFLTELNNEYDMSDTAAPNYLIIVSLARFADNYYNLRRPGVSVIGLGNWKRFMAPPSIIEFIQTLIVRESIASICPTLRSSIHLGTRGCICDFTALLEDARYRALNGYLCGYCRGQLEAQGFTSLASEVEDVLGRKWLGDLSENSSVACIVAKLGVNLFATKGLAPTWRERFMGAIREDGVREFIKLFYGIALAGLLVWLGLKTGKN
jgi:hypothetical protein